jgi:FkbM family methyltransferase
MEKVTFTNDDNVVISLIDHPESNTFKMRVNSEVLFRRINTFLIKNKIIKNNIIDLGAWIGDNSIPWAKNISGIVYAIDPSPKNCDFINETCKLNEITNVKILQYAITNKAELLTTDDDLGHCSFVYRNPMLNGRNKVEGVSLDYLYASNMIDNIGYIHLDVEGMEYKVVEGSENIINTFRPIITFEQHLEIDNYDMIVSLFKKHNYIVFLINEILPNCRHDCRNSIAFPAEIYNDNLIHDIHNNIGRNLLERK